jgi:hypothetical protein
MLIVGRSTYMRSIDFPALHLFLALTILLPLNDLSYYDKLEDYSWK